MAYYALLFQQRLKTQRLETQKKICAVYGEGAMTDQTCQKWFVKFHAVDFLLDDAPWLGRPVKVDSSQIKTVIENNQCYTMYNIGRR